MKKEWGDGRKETAARGVARKRGGTARCGRRDEDGMDWTRKRGGEKQKRGQKRANGGKGASVNGAGGQKARGLL